MKRASREIAIVATLLMTVLLSGMALVRNGHIRTEQKDAEPSMNLLLPQSSSEPETKYVMQWDDASKKLLFDGQAVSHAAPTSVIVNHTRFLIEKVAPAPDRPDQYSFDIGIVGNFASPSDSSKYDGQLHYGMQWEDAKERFVFGEPAPEQVAAERFMFNTGCGWR
jgi:hypothetical protein